MKKLTKSEEKVANYLLKRKSVITAEELHKKLPSLPHGTVSSCLFRLVVDRKLVKRSKSQDKRTAFYRAANVSCPVNHTDFGHQQLLHYPDGKNVKTRVSKKATPASSITLLIPEIGEVSLSDARKIYEELGVLFG